MIIWEYFLNLYFFHTVSWKFNNVTQKQPGLLFMHAFSVCNIKCAAGDLLALYLSVGIVPIQYGSTREKKMKYFAAKNDTYTFIKFIRLAPFSVLTLWFLWPLNIAPQDGTNEVLCSRETLIYVNKFIRVTLSTEWICHWKDGKKI